MLIINLKSAHILFKCTLTYYLSGRINGQIVFFKNVSFKQFFILLTVYKFIHCREKHDIDCDCLHFDALAVFHKTLLLIRKLRFLADGSQFLFTHITNLKYIFQGSFFNLILFMIFSQHSFVSSCLMILKYFNHFP